MVGDCYTGLSGAKGISMDDCTVSSGKLRGAGGLGYADSMSMC